MAYFTPEELQARTGGAAIWNDLTDNADATVIAGLVDGVCDEADGYFRAGGYAVPLDAALVASVKGTLLDIANFKAMSRGSREPAEKDVLANTAAIARLRDIASGKFLLGVDPVTADTGGQYEVQSDEQLLDRESLSGW